MATSNFIDTATIWLHAGKGGDGAVTFHTAKNSWRRAAPTAVTAGAAGDIIFVRRQPVHLMDSPPSASTPRPTARMAVLRMRMSGADGDDLVIRVPRGTVLKEAETDLVA